MGVKDIMMPKIFISYRRDDSRKDAGRIYDRLVEAFGKPNVFKDVDSIPMGRDFRGVLREAVAQCDVQLVIIGKSWLNITDDRGSRRLDNPGDFVRIEVESALQRDGCLVVPVLVDGASMPRADDLPPELRELAFKNAVIVRDDPDFHNDVTRIIHSLGGGPARRPEPIVAPFDAHEPVPDAVEPDTAVAGDLQVLFPNAVTYSVSRQNRTLHIGRVELKNTSRKAVPAGWRIKLVLLRPVDFRVTLTDTIILSAFAPGSIIPIGPYTVDLPNDITSSKDIWHVELYVISSERHENLLFRSAGFLFS